MAGCIEPEQLQHTPVYNSPDLHHQQSYDNSILDATPVSPHIPFEDNTTVQEVPLPSPSGLSHIMDSTPESKDDTTETDSNANTDEEPDDCEIPGCEYWDSLPRPQYANEPIYYCTKCSEGGGFYRVCRKCHTIRHHARHRKYCKLMPT